MVQLSKKGNSYSISSSCPYHYSKMSYTKAIKPTNSSPCTNVPVHCPICPPNSSGQLKTFWKYNAMYHFVMEHAENNEELPPIPPSFLVETFITSQKESLMGVKKEVTSNWRKQYNIPGTDGFEEMKDSMKRERAESNVTQPPTKTVHR